VKGGIVKPTESESDHRPHPVFIDIGELRQIQHDIRTPLNTIFGLAELYRMSASTTQTRQMAATLKSSAKDLQRMLDSLFASFQEQTAHDLQKGEGSRPV
jgi:light-regulated signal transduction histidine kinase (bacteriophytochrome)